MTVNEELKKIREILEKFDGRISKLEGEDKMEETGNPKIASSITGYLLEMKDDGFFDTPKQLKEIIQELARLGHYYKSSSVTNPIQRLIQQKKLGRIGKKGKWEYVSR